MAELIGKIEIVRALSSRINKDIDSRNWKSPECISMDFQYFVVSDSVIVCDYLLFPNNSDLPFGYYIVPFNIDLLSEYSHVNSGMYCIFGINSNSTNSVIEDYFNGVTNAQGESGGIYYSEGTVIMPNNPDIIGWFSTYSEYCVIGFKNLIEAQEFKRINTPPYCDTLEDLAELAFNGDVAWARKTLGRIADQIVKHPTNKEVQALKEVL